MQILRVPPYNLSVTLNVGSASTEYDYIITDMADSSVIEDSITSSANSKVVIPISSKYDTQYKIEVDGDEYFIDVVRPYINPDEHGTTASEIATYASNEELARAIIDSVCDVEFYYKKKVIQTTGQGTDYLPIWVNGKKVLKVYENNVLLYDADDLENSVSAFEIIPDGSAITMTFNDAINRDESARILLPASPTDIAELDYSARGFPKGWDYTIILEVGYNKVPSDIVRATELLIHDIDCGKLDYYKRYIGAYNTDQFRIQFDKTVFEGTGNLIVDKILDKYRKPIEFVGVL
jgi:6-pyruvoyl-tetrahydropterin synthase